MSDITQLAPSVTIQEIPTALLRWNEGVLEQQWEVRDHRYGYGGETTSIEYEWRPVPDAALDTKGE